MPRFEIETPQGRFEVDAPDQDTALRALQGMGQPGPAPEMPAAPQAAPQASVPPQLPSLLGGSFGAATEGSHAGLMGGFDDEITAGMLAPVDAAIDWFKGDGFDMGRAYTRKQQMLDAQKQQRRQDHPVASIAGEVAGGLALGSVPGRAGMTLAGRSVPGLAQIAPRTAAAIPAAIEGAGYGALYGAGEAKPGERLAGAGTGAAIGGVTGGLLQAGGNAIATRGARKAAQASAPAADDLATASQRLYQASEQQGVTIKAPAVQRLGGNLKLAAGQINDKLRPLTSGTVDDVDRMLAGNMSLKEIDEFRQGINLDLKAAKGQDVKFLTRMKGIVDSFLDNLAPGDMTGGQAGVSLLKDARQLWARSAKARTIENILDQAGVDGAGKYTQSGFANAIRREMNTLYKSIKKGKAPGWTAEEVALIKQMASGGSNSKLVNLFAKFAPRGVVSIIGGQAAGSLLPVAGNVAVPLLGEVAGRAADRGAQAAAQALRAGTATGTAPFILPQISQRAGRAIPGLVAPSMGTGQSLATRR